MEFPELDELFQSLLATNRGPGYGLTVLKAAPDRSVIDVEMRFLAGRSYCCSEPMCHLPRGTERLRRLASERRIQLPAHVSVHWHFIVEAGVQLECLRQLGIAQKSSAFEFDATMGDTDTE